MLEGDWAERKRSEIELPDDPCRAFEIVLYTAHWNFPMLPPALNVRELAELAILTDRYDLIRVMHIALEVKEWLLPHKKTWIKWSPNPDLQDFVMMTLFFSRSTEFDFLVNRLAVEVQVDEQDGHFYYSGGDEYRRVKLRSSLPDRILGKQIMSASPRILCEDEHR
jgi:hypothetical protein